MFVQRLVLLAAAVALAACSDNPYGSSNGCTPTASQVCTVSGNAFSPLTLTVSAGTTVTWRNGDRVSHTVTNDAGSNETFNSSLGSGGSVTHTFNTPGRFPYHCTFHGSAGIGMHGTIAVN